MKTLIYKIRRWWICREQQINDGCERAAWHEYQRELARINEARAYLSQKLIDLDAEHRAMLIELAGAPMPDRRTLSAARK